LKISDKKFRLGQKLPDPEQERFLNDLNERLAESITLGQSPEHPVIFVTGSPRSGTTVMGQSMSNYFSTDYVDGVAARYWLAPLTGLRMSRIINRAQRASAFTSEFGRAGVFDIHSFHYFWMHHLKLQHVGDLFRTSGGESIDWDLLISTIAAMQKLTKGPFTFKGYYPSYFMAEFCRRIPQAVFVITRRETVQRQAESLYEARIAYHGKADIWHSMHPPRILELMKLSPEDQIAGQIFGLNEYFDEQIEAAGSDIRAINVSYQSFIEEPDATMEMIGDRIEDYTGTKLERTGVSPVIRERERKSIPDGAAERLSEALKRYQEA
jgi:hypothetical protein